MKLCSAISNEIIDYHPVKSYYGVSPNFILKVVSELTTNGIEIICKQLIVKKKMLIEVEDYLDNLNYRMIDYNSLPVNFLVT